MHPSLRPFLSLCLLCCLASSSCLSGAAPPKALVAPIVYDTSTSLYAVSPLGGPPFDRALLLNLDSSNLWKDCMDPLISLSTLQAVLYGSAICNSASVQTSLITGDPGYVSGCTGLPTPICSNNSCSVFVSGSSSSSPNGVLWTGTISLLSTDGAHSGPLVSVPMFAFACSDDILLNAQGALPSNAVGAAGLSRAALALPTQLARKLSIQRRFAYCLPRSSIPGNGILFFGRSPYVFPPAGDISNHLRYTPLVFNPQEADSYFVGVKYVSVNKVQLPINSTLLQLTNNPSIIINGEPAVVGGTSISSTIRYTQLESSIYDALAREFTAAATGMGLSPVGAEGVFETCFDASAAQTSGSGYAVPEITLTFQGGQGASWTFTSSNSVAVVGDGKHICLAFQRLDKFQIRSIVLGTYQQQDALLVFDIANSMLGFVPDLAGLGSHCSNFPFSTSH
ncbi:hypothetical protein KP509_02G083800 [Ceratopteris richardii]|uniref:Peptidase A1 domain-containing protein n=1 Tax=Ceratopteris richardii TaxID=49495 RepID=A0A8T2V807_CERRI|nr:hypothetical protein KP509_02G083800 [Ceratopteris richardii]